MLNERLPILTSKADYASMDLRLQFHGQYCMANMAPVFHGGDLTYNFIVYNWNNTNIRFAAYLRFSKKAVAAKGKLQKKYA